MKPSFSLVMRSSFSQQPSSNQQFLVHGRTCSQWEEPTSLKDWEQLALERGDRDDGSTTWDCPACGEQVMFQSNSGEIDLGI